MKKINKPPLILMFFFLFTKPYPISAANVFKEGVYKPSDFNFSPSNLYSVQNVSADKSVFIGIFDDKNTIVKQTIKLGPKSLKYKLLPLNPTDKIMIVGNGEAYISERTS